MTAKLLRIGELAERAGVSTRTVDFYTGLGLLAPAKRTGGNFRLYAAADVGRIGLIRRLEAQGIRLEDIVRALTARDGSVDGPGHPLSLAELEEQIRALREVAARADPRALGVLATLTARAQALITTAVVLAGELVGDIELPPL